MAGPRLIDLQTDLKSLRYGSDKPYITKDINNPPTSNQTGMQILKRVDDLSRIAQMLIDRPGLKFIGNQALLQQVDVQDKLQKSRDNGKTFGGALIQQGLSTIKKTAQILGSTIAQVPVNGTGTHFVYAFRTDTYLQPSGGNTRSAFAQFFGAGGVEGAPFALKGKEVPGKATTQFINNRGEAGSPNGSDPKFAYNSPVNQDGDGGTNWNEKKNAQIVETIPRESSREYSKLGKAIPVNRSAPVPAKQTNADTGEVTNSTTLFVPNPLNSDDTTRTPGSLGISNRDVAGDISQLQQPDIKPFKEEDQTTKAKNGTASNISNALSGSAIPVKSEGASETTAAVQGSVSNQGVQGSGLPLSEDNLPKNSYTADSTYTGVSDAITKAASAGSIPFTKYKNENSEIQNSKSIAEGNKGTAEQSVQELARTYSDKSTYTAEQKNRKIGASKKYAAKERRVALGDQGASSKAGVNYWTKPSITEIDQINSIDVTTAKPDGVGAGRDLAKLYFEILPVDPEAASQFLYFRAHIDNLSDDYGAEWQGHRYVGRAEEFYTYGGFNRTITLDFKIAAATRAEMKPLYKKMVFLASTTAPTYGGVYSKFMRGTFTKLTVGSYLDQMPGIIQSVKYSLIDGMPWEIAMGQPEGVEPDSQVLPMGLQCSVTFKPIHDFAPQTGLYHYFTNGKENPRFF